MLCLAPTFTHACSVWLVPCLYTASLLPQGAVCSGQCNRHQLCVVCLVIALSSSSPAPTESGHETTTLYGMTCGILLAVPMPCSVKFHPLAHWLALLSGVACSCCSVSVVWLSLAVVCGVALGMWRVSGLLLKVRDHSGMLSSSAN